MFTASDLLGLFLPAVCHICACPLVAGERLLCAGCLAEAPRTLLHRAQLSELNARLGRPPVAVAHAGAWLKYSRSDPFGALIRRAKYNNRPDISRELGRIYARELMADGAFSGVDVLLPVPMHILRRLRRGYNQAREVALGMAEVTSLPVGDNLVAVRPHATQTRRSIEQRMANLAGTMAVRYPEELLGLHIAIVDDIFTTGSTVREALDVLGTVPSAVSVYALATSPRNCTVQPGVYPLYPLA